MKADEYRARAEEMGRLAAGAETPEQFRGYLELRQALLDMAAIAERVEAQRSEDGA
ncbi:MAG TPA: hypothetical protein VL460_12030 [Caulobacteraceae bacterium]|jgi:hypothetical protein|nr:hypothetical protein [Caulobacteraceae bacterium]